MTPAADVGGRAEPVVPTAPAIELCGISAGYGRVEVLRDVTLVVPAGQVFALLGPNGAGKSTLLRVASGRLHPSAGQVLIDGRDVTRVGPDRLARTGVCSVPEGRGVFPSLSVEENLRMWTYRGRATKRNAVEEVAYARFPRLAERRRQAAGTLSGGEQQMLAMSRALATQPSLLILDEVSMGLAPLVVGELYDLIAQLATEGLSILLAEQFAQTALGIAHRAAVMAQGRIELEGTPLDVADLVGDIYLRTDAQKQQRGSTSTERDTLS